MRIRLTERIVTNIREKSNFRWTNFSGPGHLRHTNTSRHQPLRKPPRHHVSPVLAVDPITYMLKRNRWPLRTQHPLIYSNYCNDYDLALRARTRKYIGFPVGTFAGDCMHRESTVGTVESTEVVDSARKSLKGA